MSGLIRDGRRTGPGRAGTGPLLSRTGTATALATAARATTSSMSIATNSSRLAGFARLLPLGKRSAGTISHLHRCWCSGTLFAAARPSEPSGPCELLLPRMLRSSLESSTAGRLWLLAARRARSWVEAEKLLAMCSTLLLLLQILLVSPLES